MRRLNPRQVRGKSACLAVIVIPLVVVAIATFVATSPTGAASTYGTISGTVTVDHGVVRGFQVKAKDKVHRITYTVFTRAGHYRISGLVPGSYDVRVVEKAFAFPSQSIDLKAGENKTVDMAGQKAEPKPSGVELVDYDTLYAPTPARAILERNCMGCHGRNSYQHMGGGDEDAWRTRVENMTSPTGSMSMNGVPPRPNLASDDKETIIKYLAQTFGPETPPRDLKLDELEVDESAVGNAEYVEYDMPAATKGRRGVWDLNIAGDGMIWLADSSANSIDRFNPAELDFEKRFKEYPVTSENARPTGLTSTKDGIIYFGESNGGHLGTLDPRTGEMTENKIPSPGAMHSVELDSHGNVWYIMIQGNKVGKWDPVTRQFSDWELPTLDEDPYSMIVGKDDKVYYAAIVKHAIGKFDPATQKFTEYPTPTQPSGPRRLGMDSKGKIWFGEFFGQSLGYLDPETGKMIDYKFPLRYTQGYEAWADHEDNIWVSDNVYNCLIKFNQRTKKFVYYPLPQLQPSGIPKIRVAKDGTIWFGYRGVPNPTIVAFRPNGNASN